LGDYCSGYFLFHLFVPFCISIIRYLRNSCGTLLGTYYSIWAHSRSVRNAADTKEFSSLTLENSKCRRFRNGPALEYYVPSNVVRSFANVHKYYAVYTTHPSQIVILTIPVRFQPVNGVLDALEAYSVNVCSPSGSIRMISPGPPSSRYPASR